MKTIAWVSAFALAGGLTAGAQGVHLNGGDILSWEFNGVSMCQFTQESFIGGRFFVSLGMDMLGPGDTLRLEMFENGLNEAHLVVETYDGSTPLGVLFLQSPQSWLDFQGVIRLTMLSGSVDVSNVRFDVLPNLNTLCFNVVAVPEPSTCLLAGLGGAIGAGCWISRLFTPKPL